MSEPPLVSPVLSTVANFDPDTFSVMHCEFCSAGFDTRAGLSSHARAHLRDFGITNWDVTISPIHILRELFSSRPDLVIPTAPPRSPGSSLEEAEEDEEDEMEEEEGGIVEVKLEGETSERTLGAAASDALPPASPQHCKEEDSEEECEGKFYIIDPSCKAEKAPNAPHLSAAWSFFWVGDPVSVCTLNLAQGVYTSVGKPGGMKNTNA